MVGERSQRGRSPARYGVLLAVAAAAAAAAPYVATAVGLEVNTRSVVEVVDHVVPGAVVILVGVFAAVTARLPLPAATLALLAGLWMTLTHIPLIADARSGVVGWGPALVHSLPAIAVLVVAGAATVSWAADGDAGPERP